MKRCLLLLPAVLLAACGGGSPPPDRTLRSEGTVRIERMTPAPAQARTATSTPQPQLCLVTREIGVDRNYVPPDLVPLPPGTKAQEVMLRKGTAEALLKLIAAAHTDGFDLVANSGFRSYDYQAQVLQEEIRRYGQEQATRQVAAPGHSEHQLGVAVDIATARAPFGLEEEFANTPEGRWLGQNAPRFGFVISYPYGKEAITGYVFEPWHIRYVGLDLAQKITASGQTLTEYLPAHGMDGCPPTT